MITKTNIQPGDVFSVAGRGLSGWLNEHGTVTKSGQHTKRFHFGLIADPVYNLDGQLIDFETRESISKGPSALRFFAGYTGKDIELYRLPGITPELGLSMVRSVSLIGQAGYGYKDFFKAALDVFCLIMALQFPPYEAKQFRISAGPEYICTELVAYAARQISKPVEAPDDLDEWDIPVVYLEAIEQGRLNRPYYRGDLTDIVPGGNNAG